MVTGIQISFRVSVDFNRLGNDPITPPPVHIRHIKLFDSSLHHGSRIQSPIEPRTPSEIPDPALDSALGQPIPVPLGFPVRSHLEPHADALPPLAPPARSPPDRHPPDSPGRHHGTHPSGSARPPPRLPGPADRYHPVPTSGSLHTATV